MALIGGGLVGLGAAYQLLKTKPGAKVIVLEKERTLARHQSTRNSGVIHSGVYYKQGSYKAKLCFEGRELLLDFVKRHGVSHQQCGKLIVATSPAEVPRLHTIRERGIANGIAVESLSLEALKEREPHVAGVEGLWVSATGIVDFLGVAQALQREIIAAGGEVITTAQIERAQQSGGGWVLGGECGEFSAKFVVNCGGLFCDRIVALFGERSPLQIIPFRGEYYLLTKEAEHLCRGLIYPVPDPAFPFLGVHFTRRYDGTVECGPNAVLALAREGYSWAHVNVADLYGMASYSGFRRLITKHWRMGCVEMYRSLSKTAFVKALQKLVPEVCEEHLLPADAGVRAQAVRPDGTLEEDFYFHHAPGVLHVLNAPSPAATSCLAIGKVVTNRVVQYL